MDTSPATLAALAAELDGLVGQIRAQSEAIAQELRKAPPNNSARVVASRHAITRLTRQFAAYFQRQIMAQREEAARLAERDGGRGVLPPDWQQLNTQVGLTRNWLNQWPTVQQIVDDQFPPRRRKLHAGLARAQQDETVAAQLAASDGLFDRLHAILNPAPQSDAARDRGCYPDIALPHSRFMAHLQSALRVHLAGRRPGARSFLDVGSGGGLKVLAASAFFDLATGLEFDRGYAASARRLFRRAGAGACSVVRTDALAYRQYDRHDVVYLFRPMPDAEDMARLERHIVGSVRPGTVLIAPYKGFAARHAALKCPRVDGPVYLARSTGREAVRLRRLAEYKGCHFGRRTVGMTGPFEPILRASAENGFGARTRDPLANA